MSAEKIMTLLLEWYISMIKIMHWGQKVLSNHQVTDAFVFCLLQKPGTGAATHETADSSYLNNIRNKVKP